MKVVKTRGVTVIELMMAIAIMTVIVAIVYLSFTKLNSSQALDKGTLLVTSVLDEARSKTLSSKNDAQYGVYFDDLKVVLFRGAVYSSSDPNNIETFLDRRIGIKDIALSGGGSSTVFARLTGKASKSGTLKVYLRSATTTTKTINISGTGIISTN